VRPRVIDSLVGIATTSAFPVGIYWVSLPVPKIKQVQLPTYADDVALPAFARRAAVLRAAIARYDTIRYDTIRDAILTCARKPT